MSFRSYISSILTIIGPYKHGKIKMFFQALQKKLKNIWEKFKGVGADDIIGLCLDD